jgi:dihydrofolate synthase / folylpolyglutamate synthase
MNKFDPTAYLAGLNIDVMHFGLRAISGLLSRLNNPQNAYKTILIAGTNGKGSTAAMIASILQAAGYKTGLYTSPHLVDIRERITINAKIISKDDFAKTVNDVRKEIKQPVTYFEVLTAAAFLYFQRRKVDIAVLEVGLGGRLDATNVSRPLVSVITNIGHDHMIYLGNTLAAIAREKAGIIKQNGICLTAAKQKNVLNIFAEVCRKRRARLYRQGVDIKIKKQKDGSLKYHGLQQQINNLNMPLTGRHQMENTALALAVIELIAKNGFSVDNSAIRAGLTNTHWEARLEILQKNPLFVLDGAHNPAGIDTLCRALKKDFIYRRMILLFGALADKDYRRMLQKIAPLAQKIILTQLRTNRAVPVKDMQAVLKKMGYPAIVTQNVPQAIERVLALASKKDLICAAGSLYLAGELKQAFPEAASCAKKS